MVAYSLIPLLRYPYTSYDISRLQSHTPHTPLTIFQTQTVRPTPGKTQFFEKSADQGALIPTRGCPFVLFFWANILDPADCRAVCGMVTAAQHYESCNHIFTCLLMTYSRVITVYIQITAAQHYESCRPRNPDKTRFSEKSADQRIFYATIHRFFKKNVFSRVFWTEVGDTSAASKASKASNKASQPPRKRKT